MSTPHDGTNVPKNANYQTELDKARAALAEIESDLAQFCTDLSLSESESEYMSESEYIRLTDLILSLKFRAETVGIWNVIAKSLGEVKRDV